MIGRSSRLPHAGFRLRSPLLVVGAWMLGTLVLPGTGRADVPSGTSALPESRELLRALETLQEDIEAASEELERRRDAVAHERRPLAKRLERLQQSVLEQRAEQVRTNRLREQLESERESLQAEVALLERLREDLLRLFAEYAQSMETRLHAAEAATRTPRLRELDRNLAGSTAPSDFVTGISMLLDDAEAWNLKRLGGQRIEGVALDADGIERNGTFAVFGPLAWFRAGDAPLAGPVFTGTGRLLPVLSTPFSRPQIEALDRILAGEEASLPVDVTRGDANRMEQARASLLEQARAGGVIMIPLLLAGVVALVLTVWKWKDLGSVQVQGGKEASGVVRLLRSGDAAGARSAAQELNDPMASLMGVLVRHRTSSFTDLEELLHEKILACLPRLERHLGTLAVLGGIAPLLGLLGTVTGMIHTFRLVTVFGSGDARLLSGGISEALTTTAFGLLIAIPVLLVHSVLVRRVRGMVGTLEREAVRLLHELLDPDPAGEGTRPGSRHAPGNRGV